MTHNPSLRIGTPRATTVASFPQQCALCDRHHQTGSLLVSRPGTNDPMLWVCDDCQRQLARRVDDEGTLGG